MESGLVRAVYASFIMIHWWFKRKNLCWKWENEEKIFTFATQKLVLNFFIPSSTHTFRILFRWKINIRCYVKEATTKFVSFAKIFLITKPSALNCLCETLNVDFKYSCVDYSVMKSNAYVGASREKEILFEKEEKFEATAKDISWSLLGVALVCDLCFKMMLWMSVDALLWYWRLSRRNFKIN